MRARRVDVEFLEPTGRGHVQVIAEPIRADAPDVEYVRVQIEKTAKGASWATETTSFALLTDAEAAKVRDALTAWLGRHEPEPLPSTAEPPQR